MPQTPKIDMFKALFISYVFFAALASEGRAENVALATSPFDEELLPAAKISGEVLAGALEHRLGGDNLQVGAYIPSDWAAEMICARVVSIDGFYTAKNAYEVPSNWGGGFTELPYPTEHTKHLLELAPQSLGLRVTRGDCEAEPTEFTIARWNEGTLASARLLVNPLGAEVVFAYVGDAIAPVRCEEIAMSGKSAFHVQCNLDGSSGDGPLTLEILRVDGDQSFSTGPFTIWIAPY